MTNASRLAALQLITQGTVYDLGLPYDRYSYKWPGHSPGEIISFRTPEGVARQKDLPFTTEEGGNTGIKIFRESAEVATTAGDKLALQANEAVKVDAKGKAVHTLGFCYLLSLASLKTHTSFETKK